eukprot:7676825-Pyramimonas_sp.AAC.1
MLAIVTGIGNQDAVERRRLCEGQKIRQRPVVWNIVHGRVVNRAAVDPVDTIKQDGLDAHAGDQSGQCLVRGHLAHDVHADFAQLETEARRNLSELAADEAVGAIVVDARS